MTTQCFYLFFMMILLGFMFGSKDMQVEGTQDDGTKVVIFKDGDFVI